MLAGQPSHFVSVVRPTILMKSVLCFRQSNLCGSDLTFGCFPSVGSGWGLSKDETVQCSLLLVECGHC